MLILRKVTRQLVVNISERPVGNSSNQDLAVNTTFRENVDVNNYAYNKSNRLSSVCEWSRVSRFNCRLMWALPFIFIFSVTAPWQNKYPSSIGFDRYLLSEQPYEDVRRTWSQRNEIQREKLQIVKLPDDFSGEYKPESIKEFLELASRMLDGRFDSIKHSRIAIVSICIGIDICELSEPNHQAYALKQGYDYILINEKVPGIHPKMLKYLVLAWALNRGYDWLLMLDADALFTNNDVTIDGLLKKFKPTNETSLIVSRGGNWRKLHAINNGVFLLKNSEWSLNHCFEIFTSRWSFTLFLGKTLMDQPVQLSLLLAANELQWPPTIEEERGTHVLIVPKRQMNSFRRGILFSAQDVEEGCQWEPGDWIAHFASGNKYSLIIDLMNEIGMPVPSVPERFEFTTKSSAYQETDSGTCWCTHHDADMNSGTYSLSCLPRYHVVGIQSSSKIVLDYLGTLPGLLGPHMGDPVHWLTDTLSNNFASKCLEKQKKVKKYNGKKAYKAAYLRKSDSNSIHTCSFEDYGILYGSSVVSAGALKMNKRKCNHLGNMIDGQSVLFDELAIWESSLTVVRGVSLPHVINLMQPTSRVLIAVQSPVHAVHEAYSNHDIFSTVRSDKHFLEFVTNMTAVWENAHCNASNYSSCLPENYQFAGMWFAGGMYAAYLKEWLSVFDCTQVHLFDASNERRLELEKLNQYIGKNVTTGVGNQMSKRESVNNGSTPEMVKATEILERFFAPYNMELCVLVSKFPCLNITLFRILCKQSASKFKFAGHMLGVELDKVVV